LPCFIWSNLLPANSSDHSLVYHKIIQIIQQQVRQSWLYNTNKLKQQLLRVWRDVDDSIIYGALMRGVGVFKHVYRQMLDSLRNCYGSIYIYSVV